MRITLHNLEEREWIAVLLLFTDDKLAGSLGLLAWYWYFIHHAFAEAGEAEELHHNSTEDLSNSFAHFAP